MTNIIKLPVLTTLDIPVEDVLDGAHDAQLDDVLVIGYHENGELYIASSSASLADLYLMSNIASDFLLNQVIDGE
jgi:hypothetical protein